MKKITKALTLNRDTVRQLESQPLSLAAGGGLKNTLTACTGFENSGCPHSCLC